MNTAPQVQKANNELETTKGKIRQIYKIHSPETNVDDVLHRYQGKEQQLLAGCRAAWEQAPSQSMPPFPSQPSRPPKASSSTIAPSQPAQNVRPSQRAPLSQPPQSQRALPLNRQTVLTQPRAPPPKASTIPSDRIPPPPPKAQATSSSMVATSPTRTKSCKYSSRGSSNRWSGGGTTGPKRPTSGVEGEVWRKGQ